MKREAFFGALLLVIVGVALGATVFRTDIAQATGLAQDVTVNNTPAQAVPVREQNLHTNITFHAQTNSNNEPPTNCFNADIYTVPVGKQFVAQFVSINSATGTPATTVNQASLYNASQGEFSDFASFVLTKGSLGRWAGSQTLDLVFPSGATLGFQVQPDAATNPCITNGAGAAFITVGGYLEPAP